MSSNKSKLLYDVLLFYNRGLRCLIAIELKLEKLEPAYKRQIELYPRWLDKHERQEHDEASVGLILCRAAATAQVELLLQDDSDIRIAEYMTELPSRSHLQAKLHQALEIVRAHQLSSPEEIQG